ncbi:MAG: hypothetical protein ACE5JG_04720 [Planctomycetota bacterium]
MGPLSLGSERLAGHDIRCDICAIEAESDARRYAAIADSVADLDRLLRETHPALAEVAKARRDASADRRRALLKAFRLVDALPSRQRQRRVLSPRARTIAVTTILILMPLFGLLLTFEDSQLARSLMMALGLVILAGLWLSVFNLLNQRRSFRRRQVYPRLGWALAPLEPTLVEIEEALRELQHEGLLVGRVLPARRVSAAVDRWRGAGGPAESM